MINKENSNKETPAKDAGCTDTAHVDVQCHVLIKDKDTGNILVNKRG